MAAPNALFKSMLEEKVGKEQFSIWKSEVSKTIKLNHALKEVDEQVKSGSLTEAKAEEQRTMLERKFLVEEKAGLHHGFISELAKLIGRSAKVQSEIDEVWESTIDGYETFKQAHEALNNDLGVEAIMRNIDSDGVVHHIIGGVTKVYDKSKFRTYNFFRTWFLSTERIRLEKSGLQVDKVFLYNDKHGFTRDRNNKTRPYAFMMDIHEMPWLEHLCRKLNMFQQHASIPESFDQEPDADGIICITGRKLGEEQIMLHQTDDQTKDIILSAGLVDKEIKDKDKGTAETYSALYICKPILYPSEKSEANKKNVFNTNMTSEGLFYLVNALRQQMSLLTLPAILPDADEEMFTLKLLPRNLLYKPNLTEEEKTMKEVARQKLEDLRKRLIEPKTNDKCVGTGLAEGEGSQCMDFDIDGESNEITLSKKGKKGQEKRKRKRIHIVESDTSDSDHESSGDKGGKGGKREKRGEPSALNLSKQ